MKEVTKKILISLVVYIILILLFGVFFYSNQKKEEKERVENEAVDSKNSFLIDDLSFLCVAVDSQNIATVKIFQNNYVIGEFKYEPTRSDKLINVGDMFSLKKRN